MEYLYETVLVLCFSGIFYLFWDDYWILIMMNHFLFEKTIFLVELKPLIHNLNIQLNNFVY